ncbi:MAG: NnrS family protein [Pseudomonadota bacterium]
MLHQLENNNQPKFALFNLGFRPFFLFATFSAIILIALWVANFSGWIKLSGYYQFIDWHSHEMLFAYSFAVIAGFLLTAVTNWTGLKTIEKTPLAMLSVLWLVARFLPFFAIDGIWIALCDLLFSLLVALGVAIPIIRSKQKHNLIIVAVLLLLTLANLLVHLQHLGYSQTLASGNALAIYSILMILTVVTGRVVPFFTRIVIQYDMPKVNPLLEKFLIAQLLLMAIVDMFSLPSIVMFIVAITGAMAHILRVKPWFDRRLLATPILWVLYAGYLWLIIGFIMHALAAINLITSNIAIHAWTIGAIGLLTYGMMARVSLGHTGRDMVISKLVVAGFVLIFMAAIVRVFLPIVFADSYLFWVQLSGLLWIVAFILFAYVYSMMYLQPRVDGRSG